MMEAPKDKVILLYVPEFGASAETWWPGQWSWVNRSWQIRTPFTVDDKMVMVTEIPEPIGWQCLPAA